MRYRSTCDVSDCDRKVMASGLCAMHYMRVRKYGTHEPKVASKDYKARYARWENLKKRFPGSEWQTFKEYENSVGQPNGYLMRLYPKDKRWPIGPNNFEWRQAPPSPSKKPKVWNTHTKIGKAAYDKFLRERDPNRERRSVFLRKYGLTIAQFDILLSLQGGACACCRQPETRKKRGKLMSLNIDHCHRTGLVRGLLCMDCNRGIGMLKDDPSRLRAAADYLEKFEPLLHPSGCDADLSPLARSALNPAT